jgi:hypothetical protein
MTVFPPLQPFPVYLPSYVVEYSYMGHDFRALVNGVNGQVGGEHHYSSFKVRSRVRYVIAQQPGLW